jgi:hypothetical protein
MIMSKYLTSGRPLLVDNISATLQVHIWVSIFRVSGPLGAKARHWESELLGESSGLKGVY